MEHKTEILKTESLCPVCLKKIRAEKIKYKDEIYMEKYCSQHGYFKTLIWDGQPFMENWIRRKTPSYPKKHRTKVQKGCPYDCGLCENHTQHTCTALIEVTQRCNLKCNFCFASAGGNHTDIDIEKIRFLYDKVLKCSGICNIQLSGGEPTVRDDLPDIIKLGFDMGFKFIQVNTNGVRIAQDSNYLKKLKQAGLNSIFLQFDGTKERIYKELRGVDLLNLKIKAIENCQKVNIGVVLVPTLVPDVNVDNIGSIIDFAVERIPTVRGVHFQPVSYFGRFINKGNELKRITIPKILRNIEEQTEGRIKKESFFPPGCENSFCSFHGNFIYKGNKALMPVTQNKNSCCCESESGELGAQKSINFTARSWSGVKVDNNISKFNEKKVMTWDEILYNISHFSFSISGMAFQDAWNFDVERVKDCCIHTVSPDGALIPFCAYNVTDAKGNYMYRKIGR